jgi:hypothetical protein
MPVAGGLIGGLGGGSVGALLGVAGGLLGASAQRDATRAQTRGQQAAIDAQTRMFQQARADQLPLIQARNAAIPLYMQLLGLQPLQAAQPSQNIAPFTGRLQLSGTSPTDIARSVRRYVGQLQGQTQGQTQAALPPAQAQQIDLNALIAATPGYQFRLAEGQRAAERSAAARGSLASGSTLRALARYGEGLASQEYDNFSNRLASLIGIGQNAATTAGGFGMQTGANIGQNYANIGNARASGYANQANIYGNMIGGLGYLAGFGG